MTTCLVILIILIIGVANDSDQHEALQVLECNLKKYSKYICSYTGIIQVQLTETIWKVFQWSMQFNSLNRNLVNHYKVFESGSLPESSIVFILLPKIPINQILIKGIYARLHRLIITCT